MDTAARRAVLGSLLAGGALAAAASPADAARSRGVRLVHAGELARGDLVVGPDASVVRVASRTELASGRFRVRYTHPRTGRPTLMIETGDSEGFAAERVFVLLRRRVPVEAVTFTPRPPPGDPDVVDGGTP